MLGLSESKVFNEIDSGCFGIAHLSLNIKDQPALEPDDILRKIATGVAKAIIANNKAIENKLRASGLSI